MKSTQSFLTHSLLTLCACGLFTSVVNAQQYLNLRQDGHIYDVDVVIFARRLSQPTADSIVSKASVKSEDVLTLPFWDGVTELYQYPAIVEPPNDSVPIESQANPVRVLSNVILSTSMDHAIVNRLQANPTFKPIYRQKWRQSPSPFLTPQYIEVSNLSRSEMNNVNDFNVTNFSFKSNVADYSVDGQVAFSKQRYTHLHVKMNLYRVNSEGEQIVYELSQQKRVELDQCQYFDHQQFGVLAKVSAVKLEQGE